MKRILMLTDGWRRFVTYAWTNGILRYSEEHGNCITVYQFNSWGNWSKDSKFNAGQYSILRMPSLADFDGVFVDVTNIEDQAVLSEVLARVRESGLPAVSVCFETEGIPYVGVDGYQVISTMVSHLCTVHGCRSFHFVGGKADQFESGVRLRSFLDSMKKYGISRDMYRITDGDFTADTGIFAAEEYFSGENADELHLPDAFVCANDNIAVGVILELEEHGLSCPDDVLVTGFDNLDKAMYFQPQLTTATLDRDKIGYESARVLDQLMQNKDAGREIYHVPHENYVQIPVIYSESCGCPNSHQLDYRAYLKYQIVDSLNVQGDEISLSQIGAELSRARTFEEFMQTVLNIYCTRDCDGVYIVTDENLSVPDAGEAPVYFSGKIDRDALHIETFREKVPPKPYMGEKLTWGYEGEKVWLPRGQAAYGEIIEGMPEEELIRYISSHDEGDNYFFMALNIGDMVIGYILLKNPHFIIAEWRFYQVQDVILSHLSSWYSNCKLASSLHALSQIYDKDQLTGIYARTAFKTKLDRRFEKWRLENKQVAIFFADVDHFKEINDTYGHDFGDKILVQVAHAMNRHFPSCGFTVRYGGDEFVSVCPVEDPSETESIRASILRDLDRHSIAASIGMVVTPPAIEDGETLDLYIRAADREMYAIKSLHHLNNNSD